MVKRKKTSEDKKAKAVISEQPVVAVTQPVHYDIGSWAGIPQYRCKLCKFDTLHKDLIEQHIKETHLKVLNPAPSVNATTNNETDQVSPEGELNGVFEVELKEVSSTTDEEGNERKTYTIKE